MVLAVACGTLLYHPEMGLNPEAQTYSELAAHCNCLQFRIRMVTHISHELCL